MSAVGERLAAVRAQIDDAARAAGRDPHSVALLAVSKRVSVERIVEAWESGHRDFGENYVQEAFAKQSALEGRDIRWHLIGQLQSNKAARAASRFDLIHSLSSLSAAKALSRGAAAGGIASRVLIQIHLGGGTGRAGVEPARALEFARSLTELPHLIVDGVMGVAPLEGSPRRSFEQLRHVLEALRGAALPSAPLREMSAGMSSDFREAILEGATIVRIGSAVFGARGAG